MPLTAKLTGDSLSPFDTLGRSYDAAFHALLGAIFAAAVVLAVYVDSQPRDESKRSASPQKRVAVEVTLIPDAAVAEPVESEVIERASVTTDDNIEETPPAQERVSRMTGTVDAPAQPDTSRPPLDLRMPAVITNGNRPCGADVPCKLGSRGMRFLAIPANEEVREEPQQSAPQDRVTNAYGDTSQSINENCDLMSSAGMVSSWSSEYRPQYVVCRKDRSSKELADDLVKHMIDDRSVPAGRSR